jgi:branched-chain amino acid transport system substrate-binding protein
VLQLKDEQPDAIIFASYTSDIIRYMKTLKSFNYRPPVIIGDDAGFSDPAFIANVGNIAQGVLDRSAWEKGKPGSQGRWYYRLPLELRPRRPLSRTRNSKPSPVVT